MVVNKMKATEIRKLSAAELDAKLSELKKDIARIKTIIRENETKN